MTARYGRRKISRMLAEWNRLREAVHREGTPAVLAAFEACEEWVDFAYAQAREETPVTAPQITTLPATEAADDLTDRIAKEIAALVVEHIETMYPAAAQAVAWGSCARSLQGLIRNAVSSAGCAAESGRAEEWIKTSRANRARLRATRKETL